MISKKMRERRIKYYRTRIYNFAKGTKKRKSKRFYAVVNLLERFMGDNT